jgi:hypothetical protein
LRRHSTFLLSNRRPHVARESHGEVSGDAPRLASQEGGRRRGRPPRGAGAGEADHAHPKVAVDRALVEQRLAEGLEDAKKGRVHGPPPQRGISSARSTLACTPSTRNASSRATRAHPQKSSGPSTAASRSSSRMSGTHRSGPRNAPAATMLAILAPIVCVQMAHVTRAPSTSGPTSRSALPW